MFRKVILSAVLGTGLLTGLTLTANTAEAHPPARIIGHDFRVLYRRTGCGWVVYGNYCNRFEANRAAESLRCHGYFVSIRPC